MEVEAVLAALRDPADQAAVLARMAWVDQATNSIHKGKQIPPEGDWNVLIYRCGRGWGKMLSEHTPIPTPSGWTTMGDCAPGMELFDEMGRVCRVLVAHPIVETEDSWKVCFSDGAEIEACGGHLWATWTHRDRKQYLRYGTRTDFPDRWADFVGGIGLKKNSVYGPEIRTTKDIASTLRHGGRGDLNHCIPSTRPLVLDEAKFILDPYVLGYWIGNGTCAEGSVTTGSLNGDFDDDWVVHQFRTAGYACTVKRIEDGGSSHVRVQGLVDTLRDLRLLGNKHVPSTYLRGSVEQRTRLLQGLCDSDGYAWDSHVEFCTMDRKLADAVLELTASLGEKAVLCVGRATIGTREYGEKYRVNWTAARVQPFTLPRKVRTCPVREVFKLRHRMITAVEPITPRKMRCITVDSPSGLYLAGRAMIPTHNTRLQSEALWWDCYQYPGIIGHFLGATLNDVRGTLFEGPAGMLACTPKELMLGGTPEKAYNKTLHELKFANGGIVRGFATTEQGERLRGPQCHLLCGDEVAAWDRPAGNLEIAFNNAMYGTRLPYPGNARQARAILGSTPRPLAFLKKLEKRSDVKIITGSSYENLSNLSPAYRAQLLSNEGTQMGKQEIHGLFVDEESELSIWKRGWIKLWPSDRPLPEFAFVIESYDTAFSEMHFDSKKMKTDPTACVVLGVFNMASVYTEEERRKAGLRARYGVLLCDAWSDHLGLPDLISKAVSQHKTKWGKPGRKSDIILVEDKGSGISLRQTLVSYGLPTWPYNPNRESKVMRAHSVAPLLKDGLFFIPESTLAERKGLPRNWCEPYLEEICSFAGKGSTEHDDFVDATSQALIYLKDREFLQTNAVNKFVDYEEERDRDREAAEIGYKVQQREVKGNPYG